MQIVQILDENRKILLPARIHISMHLCTGLVDRDSVIYRNFHDLKSEATYFGEDERLR